MKKIAIKFFLLLVFFGFNTLYVSTASAEHYVAEVVATNVEIYQPKPISEIFGNFLKSTGINALINPNPDELDS